MKYVYLENNKILGWYDSEIHYKIIKSKITLNKLIETDLKGDELNQKIQDLVSQNKQTLLNNDNTLVDVKFLEVRNNKVILEGSHKISTIPEGAFEVSQNVWQEAVNINANYYDPETKKFVVKDLRTQEELQSYEKSLIPKSITLRQARLYLLSIGLLDDLENIINQNRAYQIEWEYANEIERESPLVTAMAQALILTSSDVDNMFIEASKI